MILRRQLRLGCRSFCKEVPPGGGGSAEDAFSQGLHGGDQMDGGGDGGATAFQDGILVGPLPDTLTTAATKTRKGRSEHYFRKKNRVSQASTLDELKMESVIRSYTTRGHLAALIDPLYIVRKPMFRPEFPSRTVLKQRRVPTDRDITYLLANDTSLGSGKFRSKLGELIRRLNAAYCSTIGFEFTHLQDDESRNWIKERIESTELRFIDNTQKIFCAKELIKISEFSAFLETNTDTRQNKRYNVDGSETSPLGLQILIQRAASKYGARDFVLGMRRLARFLVLSTLGINHADLFQLMTSSVGVTREKNCLGTIFQSPSPLLKNSNLQFVMVANPSIPQSFYPIVLGKAKGLQDMMGDDKGKKVWPIIVHMAKGLYSQGITYETLKLSILPSFNTHGSIHLIFNNQMEETLRREVSMKTAYCTDVFKAINAPIFHVNGDDIAAVHFVCCMAADYRARFQRDVVIDIVSYQRGMARRPQTKYGLVRVQEKINQTKPLVPRFLENLQKNKIITQQEIDLWKAEINHQVSQDWVKVQQTRGDINMKIWSAQTDLNKVKIQEETWPFDFDTGIKEEILRKICASLCKVPDNFKISTNQLDLLQKRLNLVEKDTLDWIMCEALAYGSLLLELKNIRITGMDVNRRLHIIQDDNLDGKEYNLLQNISDSQGRYYLCKSTTSQYATAGFEYGYSTASIDTQVVWEAPEGDKTSKAQVIIDNFIAGGYVKYNYHSNMIMLLPHYLKCESPTRACNGRPERFLQLVNNYETETENDMKKQIRDTNMIVANVSTPANFFHILRRQMYLPYRRPLVIFTPNLISSHPNSKARFSDLSTGTRFQPYFPDDVTDSSEIVKVLLCTGKIYYDLKHERNIRNLENKIAICRIEQLSPLPYKIIIEDMKRYYNNRSIAWVQEEPLNQGWFNYVEPRLLNLPNFTQIEYYARPAKADGGSRSVNTCLQEQEQIYNKAFTLL